MRDQVRLNKCFEYCYNFQVKGKEINSQFRDDFFLLKVVVLWENNVNSETIL